MEIRIIPVIKPMKRPIHVSKIAAYKKTGWKKVGQGERKNIPGVKN